MNFIQLKWISSIFICLKTGFRKESIHNEIAISNFFFGNLKKKPELKIFQ